MKRAIAIVLLAACDAQVDGDYAGDAYARLRGVTIGFPVDAVIDGVTVRWTAQLAADLDAGPSSQLPLEFEPPAVIVPVVTLPSNDAHFGFADDPVRIAEGRLFVTHDDALVGEAIDFALVHVEGDVQPGSLAADYLGGVVAPGYHLCETRATARLSDAQAYFANLCGATPACTQPRLYRLVPTTNDLATALQFFRGRR